MVIVTVSFSFVARVLFCATWTSTIVGTASSVCRCWFIWTYICRVTWNCFVIIIFGLTSCFYEKRRIPNLFLSWKRNKFMIGPEGLFPQFWGREKKSKQTLHDNILRNFFLKTWADTHCPLCNVEKLGMLHNCWSDYDYYFSNPCCPARTPSCILGRVLTLTRI